MNQSSSVSFGAEQVQAKAEDAVRVAAEAGAAAESLISEWVKASNASAVDAVAQNGTGAARKAARRALNILKARGVPIPSAPRRGALAEVAAPADPLAWLLPPDVAGNEAIVLAKPTSNGRYRTTFVFFRDGQRALRVQNGILSFSKIKDQMAEALGTSSYSAVSVPYGWGQHRVVALRNWHASRNVPEPLGLNLAAELLQDLPAEPPPHPFDEEGLALSDEDAAEMAKSSHELHRWPEFRPWLPTTQALEELLTQLGSRVSSLEPTDKEAFNPIVTEEVAAATDRYFTPELRAIIVERLKDSGISVMTRLGEQAGLQVAALVRAIENAGLITNPPREIGFLRAFFDKGLALIASRNGGQLRLPVPAGSRAAGGGANVPATAEAGDPAAAAPPEAAAPTSSESAPGESQP
jgi:hypothetical protein